jgi:hypothetical protein
MLKIKIEAGLGDGYLPNDTEEFEAQSLAEAIEIVHDYYNQVASFDDDYDWSDTIKASETIQDLDGHYPFNKGYNEGMYVEIEEILPPQIDENPKPVLAFDETLDLIAPDEKLGYDIMEILEFLGQSIPHVSYHGYHAMRYLWHFNEGLGVTHHFSVVMDVYRDGFIRINFMNRLRVFWQIVIEDGTVSYFDKTGHYLRPASDFSYNPNDI